MSVSIPLRTSHTRVAWPESDDVDVRRLNFLRQSVSNLILEESEQALPLLMEYHSCLVELDEEDYFGPSSPLSFEWDGVVVDSLAVERQTILWNISACWVHQAFADDSSWDKTGKLLQSAASLLKHVDGAKPTECVLVAHAQRAFYEAARAGRKKPLILAKVAQAAVPLFETAAAAASNNDNRELQAWTLYMNTVAEYHQASADKKPQVQRARLERVWRLIDLLGDYELWDHQVEFLNQIHQDISEKLQAQPSDTDTVDIPEIRGQVVGNVSQPLVKVLPPHPQSVFSIDQERDFTPPAATPHRITAAAPAAGPPLPPRAVHPSRRQSSGEQHQEEAMYMTPNGARQAPPASSSSSSFPSNNNNNNSYTVDPLEHHIQAFESEVQSLVVRTKQIADEKTETARRTLMTVNLPHALTAYKQEHSGGGIPEELWNRVQDMQRSGSLQKLKNDLWKLRDVADGAMHIYQAIERQLDEDLEMDRLFRQQFPDFEGHQAPEVQQAFRQSLLNYQQLLQKSQEGDAVLLRRLEILDTDPKYKLLQFHKSQLDRLLPPAVEERQQAIDTTLLSRLLVELSALFREREDIVSHLQELASNLDIRPHFARAHVQDHPSIANAQKKPLFDRCYELQLNMDKQQALVDDILAENEHFQRERMAAAASVAKSSDSCIVMMEDAIEEIDQLSKHLKEGTDFYDIIIPKLEQLKHQVGDVSARLTVERCEYDDKDKQNRQLEADALMAERMNSNHNAEPHHQAHQGSDRIPRQHHPGVEAVSHGEPQVRVDDEKVASLVAMEFDPAKVVAALKKYDNNVEQALNELLSA